MYSYDLHLHSNLSDGDYSPEEVLKIAAKNGLKGVVITDHNIVEGSLRGLEEAAKQNIWSCQGLEISTSYQGIDVHILGYSRHFNLDFLEEKLRPIKDGYNERMKEVLAKLREVGIADFDFEKLLAAKGKNNCLVKYDISQALIREGKFSLKEAQSFVNRGGVAYVPYRDWVETPSWAVDVIHQAEGKAFLAHPGESFVRTSQDQETVQQLIYQMIDELVARNLDGLEVRYSKHSLSWEKEFQKLIRQKSLIMVGGSDWHGENHHPEIKMGLAGITQEEFFIFKSCLGR